MKFYFLLFILLLMYPIHSSFGQDTVVVVSRRIIRQGSEEYKNRLKKDRVSFIQKYVDSLNNYQNSTKDELPVFFTTVDFDRKYGGQFNLTVNGKVSLRKLIIDKLTNVDLMLKVKRSKDPLLKLKYEDKPPGISNYYTKIPFQQHSTYELVVMKLDEIENNQHLDIDEN